jgi:endogenous inhibitor of DNA gyrase (YacG/DUF329 family)
VVGEVAHLTAKTAKRMFETYKQGSNQPLDDFLAEKARLGEEYAKIKTTSIKDLYDELDRRDFILDALNAKWDPWRNTRKLNDTVPPTFDELVKVIRSFEAKLQLEDTAGMVNATKAALGEALKPKKCARKACGKKFAPIVETYTFCSKKCRHEEWKEQAEAKKEAAVMKEETTPKDTKATKAKPSSRKSSSKGAHHTDGDDEDCDGDADNDSMESVDVRSTDRLQRRSGYFGAFAMANDATPLLPHVLISEEAHDDEPPELMRSPESPVTDDEPSYPNEVECEGAVTPISYGLLTSPQQFMRGETGISVTMTGDPQMIEHLHINTTSRDEDLIYLDNCSNSICIRSRELALSINHHGNVGVNKIY